MERDPTSDAPRELRGRIPWYRALLTSSLVIAGSGAALVYLWAMSNLFPDVGVVNLGALGVARNDLAAIVPPRAGPTRVVRILQTRENIECAERTRFDLWKHAERWQQLAAAAGFDTDFRDEEGIPRGRRQADVLIVPWVLCLDAEHRQRIDRFLAAGGGVVMAGAIGPEPDVRPSRMLNRRWLVTTGRTPPGACLDPARRLELPATQHAMGLEAAYPVLVWSRWNLAPFELPTGGWWAAAAVASRGPGRIVWFGFPAAEQVQGTTGELDRLRALALLWAAGDAIAAVGPWPEGRDHAAVIAVDAFAGGDELRETLRQLDESGLRPTVFVDSKALRTSSELRELVQDEAELGSRGDRRAIFAGEIRVRQRRRLRESRSEIQTLTGRPVLGLHAPEERYDDLTLHESSSAGYRYLLGDPAYDRAFPRWVSTAGNRIALLPRAGSGNALAFSVSGSPREDPGAMHADLARMRRLGGLYILSVRSDRSGGLGRRAVLGRLLEDLLAGEPWRATAAEVVTWAAARQGLQLSVDPTTREIVLRNDGRHSLDDISLEIHSDLPTPRRIRISRLESGESIRLASESPAVAIAAP